MTYSNFWSNAMKRIQEWLGIAKPLESAAPVPLVSAPVGPPPVGVAWMERNRTVCVRIRLEQGKTIGDVNLTYAKRHPRYREVVASLGGLKPGEAKPVFGDWNPRAFASQPGASRKS